MEKICYLLYVFTVKSSSLFYLCCLIEFTQNTVLWVCTEVLPLTLLGQWCGFPSTVRVSWQILLLSVQYKFWDKIWRQIEFQMDSIEKFEKKLLFYILKTWEKFLKFAKYAIPYFLWCVFSFLSLDNPFPK